MFKKICLIVFIPLIFFFDSCKKIEEENRTYSIDKVWWSDSIDTNQDGYAQYRKLNFDLLLVEKTTATVDARVYYKLDDASSYTFYAYMGEQNAQGGSTDNNFFIPIGKPNKELPRGSYDFKIEVFEPKSGKVVAVTGSKDSTALTMRQFEQSTDDKSYSIKTSWSDQRDKNGNGFLAYARLNITVNIDTTLKKNVYAKLLYKNSLDNTYQLYYQFPAFTIFDHDPGDTVSYIVGSPTIELQTGSYDFRIEVYEANSNLLVALADESTSDLKDVKFEPEDSDSYHYTISKVWWSDQKDNDGDGYTQFRNLHFQTDVDQNANRTVYAKVFFQPPDSTNYSLYDSTANFNISGTSQNNNYVVGIGGPSTQLDSAKYNFLISIYEPTTDTVEAFQTSISAADDSVLANQKFEPDTSDVK